METVSTGEDAVNIEMLRCSECTRGRFELRGHEHGEARVVCLFCGADAGVASVDNAEPDSSLPRVVSRE